MPDEIELSAEQITIVLNQPRCPMCGARNERGAEACASCGEPLHAGAGPLAVPLYSAKLIGFCTFFWSLLTGMLLLWLNCRRLGLYRESHQVLTLAVVLTLGLLATIFLLPDSHGSSLVVNLLVVWLVVSYAQRLLREPYERQRHQQGPYASTLVAHGLGLLMVLVLLSLIVVLFVLLELLGVPLED